MIFSVIPDSMSDVCDFNHISAIDIDSTTNIIFVAYNLGSCPVSSDADAYLLMIDGNCNCLITYILVDVPIRDLVVDSSRQKLHVQTWDTVLIYNIEDRKFEKSFFDNLSGYNNGIFFNDKLRKSLDQYINPKNFDMRYGNVYFDDDKFFNVSKGKVLVYDIITGETTLYFIENSFNANSSMIRDIAVNSQTNTIYLQPDYSLELIYVTDDQFVFQDTIDLQTELWLPKGTLVYSPIISCDVGEFLIRSHNEFQCLKQDLDKLNKITLDKFTRLSGSVMPSWTANIVEWWINGLIDDEIFSHTVQFLLNENIVSTLEPKIKCVENFDEFPFWMKEQASEWDNKHEYLNGLEYIIQIETRC